jgi:hypothetical protein
VGLLADPTTILVTGVAEGSAVLQAGTNSILEPGPRRVLGSMMVSVRTAVLKVFFHFLDGPPVVKTTRKPGDEDLMLQMVNKLYNIQAGLEFASAGSPPLPVPGLGSKGPGVLVAQLKTPDMQRIVANARAGLFMNVFFVGDMLDGVIGGTFGQPSDFLALTDQPSDNQTPRRCCILRDPRRDKAEVFINSGMVLAHETGHALDQPDSDDPDMLMSGHASTRGVLIPPRCGAEHEGQHPQVPALRPPGNVRCRPCVAAGRAAGALAGAAAAGTPPRVPAAPQASLPRPATHRPANAAPASLGRPTSAWPAKCGTCRRSRWGSFPASRYTPYRLDSVP